MIRAYDNAMWEKNTIIKDSVHGYINIPKPIANEIVDTDVFQRLKNIEQTGMQVLYPSATHNRFMHSLGVYHLSKQAFSHFMMNVKTDYRDIYDCLETPYSRRENLDRSQNAIMGAESVWKRWELLFQLASLLHDCGHSPFSHTLEFIYDLVRKPKSLSDRLIQRCSKQFEADFRRQAKEEGNDAVGKAHERMSAYLVATGEEGEEGDPELLGGFRTRIGELVSSCLAAYDIKNPYPHKKEMLDDDIEFMVRMIIGCRYVLTDAEQYSGFKFNSEGWKLELQVRNCVIGMLNSKLDVDNLDYVVRDSKYSGYASNNIDLERLLASFTIVRAYEFAGEPLTLHADRELDASVNLESFEGTSIDAKISGECAISSLTANLHAYGNLFTETEDLSPAAERMIFRTKDTFSAKVKLEGEHFSIKPKKDKKKAYINISGRLEGEFRGVILGDTCRGLDGIKSGTELVYFAYKQNCMSVLMSAIEGSNFENKWIYAHHTTTFKNNFLVVYLLERYAGYLLEQELKAFLDETGGCLASCEKERLPEGEKLSDGQKAEMQTFFNSTVSVSDSQAGVYAAIQRKMESDEIGGAESDSVLALMKLSSLLEQIELTGKVPGEKLQRLTDQARELLTGYIKENKFCSPAAGAGLKELHERYKWIANMEMQLFAQIMSMYGPSRIQGHEFYRTDDQDLFAMYKQLYRRLLQSDEQEQRKHQEFMISYRQLMSRKSMRCLWKTYPEYNFYFSDWTGTEIRLLKNLLRRTSTPWGQPHGHKQVNYSVLSDYVSLPDNTAKLWERLKETFGLTRLVYVEQDIRTKSFRRYETYLKNRDRVVRLEDIRLYTEEQGNREFFYVFYEVDNSHRGEKGFTPYHFIQTVRGLIRESFGQTESPEDKTGDVRTDRHGNMIIRDNVHGDIVFPPLFAALVDTKEFQRLRRIKQLATAGQVFPGAVHTRFSHSIGTYHIMGKLLAHFDDYFSRLGYRLDMDEIDRKAILAAALLHDIGHGPYSHAFEDAGLATGNRTHETWSTEIILDDSTEVNRVLKTVREDFPALVAGYIQSEIEIRERSEGPDREKLNLKFIFASLVSGQIDADRMDYLLRDAKFSGVTCGQYDLEKVIEGMAVSVGRTGRYRLGILEDCMPAVEEYYYARFQMYGNIYYHPYKMFSEELLRRLLKEAQISYLSGELQAGVIPPSLENIFNQADVAVDTYCQLDDAVVDGAARMWARSGVEPLSFLCRAHLERRGYRYLDAVDAAELEEKAEQFFRENMDINIKEKHFLISCRASFQMYEKNKPLYILKKSGISVPLQECSTHVNETRELTCLFYSRECAERIDRIDEQTLNRFERLIEKHTVSNNMEIEKKYVYPKEREEEVRQGIRKSAEALGYSLEERGSTEQCDLYYDTEDFELDKHAYTLRFRKIAEENIITCKSAVSSASSGVKGQLERRETEERTDSDKPEENRDTILEMLRGLPVEEQRREHIIDNLEKRIQVKNNRIKYMLRRETGSLDEFPEKYELVLDHVIYTNMKNGRTEQECQLELELKSSYQNRINMKRLTDEMEAGMDFLASIEESKYKRALRMTNECVLE